MVGEALVLALVPDARPHLEEAERVAVAVVVVLQARLGERRHDRQLGRQARLVRLPCHPGGDRLLGGVVAGVGVARVGQPACGIRVEALERRLRGGPAVAGGGHLELEGRMTLVALDRSDHDALVRRRRRWRAGCRHGRHGLRRRGGRRSRRRGRRVGGGVPPPAGGVVGVGWRCRRCGGRSGRRIRRWCRGRGRRSRGRIGWRSARR